MFFLKAFKGGGWFLIIFGLIFVFRFGIYGVIISVPFALLGVIFIVMAKHIGNRLDTCEQSCNSHLHTVSSVTFNSENPSDRAITHDPGFSMFGQNVFHNMNQK